MRGHTDAARAYWRLRDMIIRTELAPGTALTEADLMQRVGVGRTPLRDALQRLGHDGLVEILPRRGTFVTEVTIESLQHVFEMAWSLDELLARLATDRCTAAGLVELERLRKFQTAVPVEQGAPIEIDNQVHRLLVRMAGNVYLADAYRRCQDGTLRLLYLTGCGRESHAEQRCFLGAVADALAERDAERLTATLRDHRQQLRERVAATIFSSNGRLSAQAS